MTKQILNIVFGADQQILFDKLIEEMKGEGKIIACEKKVLPEGDVRYKIEFDTPYDTYLFGYRSRDVWKYLKK